MLRVDSYCQLGEIIMAGRVLHCSLFLGVGSFSLAMQISKSNRDYIGQFYSKNMDYAFDSWDEFQHRN
jgi:hypothetical protein